MGVPPWIDGLTNATSEVLWLKGANVSVGLKPGKRFDAVGFTSANVDLSVAEAGPDTASFGSSAAPRSWYLSDGMFTVRPEFMTVVSPPKSVPSRATSSQVVVRNPDV